jgi:hypothetical protein
MPGNRKKSKAHYRAIKDATTYRPAAEDWYPNFPNGTVRIRLIVHQYVNVLGQITGQLNRVVVWGNDDFGMEQDFNTPEEAERCFNQMPSVIFKADLYARGFQNA